MRTPAPVRIKHGGITACDLLMVPISFRVREVEVKAIEVFCYKSLLHVSLSFLENPCIDSGMASGGWGGGIPAY